MVIDALPAAIQVLPTLWRSGSQPDLGHPLKRIGKSDIYTAFVTVFLIEPGQSLLFGFDVHRTRSEFLAAHLRYETDPFRQATYWHFAGLAP